MRSTFKTLLCVGFVFAVVMMVRAEDEKSDKKAKKLTGEIGCPKCVFKIEKTCGNAIKVKDGDKEVIYVFQDKRAKESYHKTICTEGKKGSVTGVISKKGDKNFVKPEKDSVKFED